MMVGESILLFLVAGIRTDVDSLLGFAIQHGKENSSVEDFIVKQKIGGSIISLIKTIKIKS